MLDYKPRFERKNSGDAPLGRAGQRRLPRWGALAFPLAAVVTAGLACSSRMLVLVDSCPDGATTNGACVAPPDGGGNKDAVNTTLLNGLVGHWHFDDGAGSTMALDSSGNDNHGTLVGLDPSTVWTTEGRLDGALETKAQGYASVPNLPRIDAIDSQVSLAAWVYLDGVINDYAAAASKQINSTVQQYYHLSLKADGRPSLYINTRVPKDSIQQPLADAPVAPRTWTHLAGTYDGAAARLYVNGTLVSSLPITGTFGRDPNPFLLGANGNSNMVSERFPGRIDEIVLYDRALTGSEIAQLALGVKF